MFRSFLIFLCIVLVSCSEPSTIKIGFIGSLTGPASDLGSRVRNGTILAIEQWNARGGVNGSTIELITKDDKNDPSRAAAMASELITEQVAAIVGPSTSAMAVSVVPVINVAKIPTFGTTVTTDDLVDLDDYFFRPVASTRAGTKHLSQFINNHYDVTNFAIVTDLSNEAYTRSWRDQFVKWMSEHEVQVVMEEHFETGDNLSLLDISQRLASIDTDMIALVVNARDAALMTKQIRSKNKDVLIVTSEWSGTSNLLSLAGSDAEGMIVPRYIDENNAELRFKTLVDQYRVRFEQDIGYAGVLAYNSTNALLDALANKSQQQTIKEYLLNKAKFDGVLASFQLNEFGDEESNAFHFITEVRQGKFMTRQD